MRRSTSGRRWGAVAAALTLAGCASGGGAAPPGPAGGTPVDSSAARLHVYEIPVSQVEGTGQAPEPAFVEVSGTGSVDVEPDLARIAFAVETRAETASDAAAENADLMTQVLEALRAAGFPSLELETFGYQLRPEYVMTENRARTIEGYSVVNNVRATVSDVGAIGSVIDTAIAAGANRVAYIAFEASDTEAARERALAQAVEAARAQARTLAESLGHELGRALEVRGGADRPFPRTMEMGAMRMAAEAVPTPIEPGAQTVTANVTVRFALGPEIPQL